MLLLQSRIFLASAAQKMIPPPDIWGAPFWRLTCGPTKLERTKGFVNLVNINDSSSSDRTMLIQQPCCFVNLLSSCSSHPNQRWPYCLLLPPMSGCAATAGHAIPLYSPTPPVILRRWQPHTAVEAVNPRTPLHVGINCHVFPSSTSSPS